MILIWVPALLLGLGLTIAASQRTLDAAQSMAQSFGLSPFLVGMTVVALGTDLPEIANSITASATGHGDVNVGDSVGSAVTQITLVLGVLCLFNVIPTNRRFVSVAGPTTVVAILIGAVLMADRNLGRIDGLILLSAWFVGMWLTQRHGHVESPRQERLFSRGILQSLRRLVGGLVTVAAGAMLIVWGFTETAEWLGVPEYATSFLALSLGTSLPELAIDGRALRQGASSLALGVLVGSSFADATVSLGIGPTFFPTEVSGSAMWGNLIAAALIAAVVVVLLSRPSHHRRSGAIFIALYFAMYLVLLA